jgi:rod shape-determining protein MreD
MNRASLGDNIQGREVLLPVRMGYVALTLLIALLLELAPVPRWIAWAWPDFVALMLVYWGVHQPHRMGLLTAWGVGLLMDVADGTMLGQHAFAYGVLMYGAIFLHRRIRMFPPRFQAVHVALLLIAERSLQLLVRLMAGDEFPGVAFFGASLCAAALWLPLAMLVKMPLRARASEDD